MGLINRLLINAAQEHPKAGLLGPKIVQMDNPAKAYSMIGRLNMWFPWPDRMEGKDVREIGRQVSEADFLSGAALLVKREFIEQVGLLDERFFFYWEENDWCERGKKSGFKALLVPDAVVFHKGGESSGKGWNEFTAYYLVRNWILFMRKHAKFYHWFTFVPLLTYVFMRRFFKALVRWDAAVMKSLWEAVVWNARNGRKLK